MSNCIVENCKNEAIFDSKKCWDHIENKSEYKDRLVSIIKSGSTVKGANFSKVDLSGLDLSKTDFSGANLSRANLSNSNFFDANLQNAELLGADLSGADLTSANLEGSDLTRSYMEGARAWHANLKNANLIEANLNRADFWNAHLFNTRLWRTDIKGAISISKASFRAKLGRFISDYKINESGFLSSEDSYRTIKQYFLVNGRYDDASWASFKEKTMNRKLLKKRRNPGYIPSLVMNLLCGYGEKPYRIILSSFFVIFSFAIAYKLMSAVQLASSAGYKMSFIDHIYFSIVTFTTVGYGDFIPKAAAAFRITAASEAFIGAFMIGLFIFTLARKYSAR